MSKRNLRWFMAAVFIVVLFAEWGSHGLAFAHSFSGEEAAVHSQHEAHEDLCETLIRCSDSSRQEQPVPTFGHDVTQRNHFLDRLTSSRHWDERDKDERIRRSRISDLSRPVSPPFYPPELS